MADVDHRPRRADRCSSFASTITCSRGVAASLHGLGRRRVGAGNPIASGSLPGFHISEFDAPHPLPPVDDIDRVGVGISTAPSSGTSASSTGSWRTTSTTTTGTAPTGRSSNDLRRRPHPMELSRHERRTSSGSRAATASSTSTRPPHDARPGFWHHTTLDHLRQVLSRFARFALRCRGALLARRSVGA